MSFRPRVIQPWVRVILVLAQVSSMKTRRLGSSLGWSLRHRARWRATSGRSCSAANKVFFEADIFLAQEAPQRIAGNDDAAFAQLRKQRMQG